MPVAGPLIGAAASIGSSLISRRGASNNSANAAQYANQTKWQNAGLNAGGYNVSSDNGNISGSISDPTNQNMAQGLYGAGSGLLGQFSPGSMSPFLQQALGASLGSMQGYDQSPQMQGFNSNPFAGIDPSGTNYNSITSGLMGQLGGLGGQLGQIAGRGGNYSTRQGNGFLGMGNAALGQLGSFDPTQAGNNYTGMLDQSQNWDNTNAANSLAQRLYNGGALGSTGGANQMEAMARAQGQQHLQNQIAGQQLGQQQQMNLAGMAQQLGQTGQGMNLAGIQSNNQSNANNYGMLSSVLGQMGGLDNQAFNQAFNTTGQNFSQQMQQAQGAYGADTQNTQGNNAALQQMYANNQNAIQGNNALANQGFSNAMGAYGQGLNTNAQSLQGALGALGLGQSFSQADFSNLLNTIGMSINNNSQMSNANVRAYNPQLQAGVAQNNTATAGNQGILGSIFGGAGGGSGGGLLGAIGGLFGGSGGGGSTRISNPFYGYNPMSAGSGNISNLTNMMPNINFG